jgi:arabinan endo-1,5-alpha-L-arabinosidase
VGGTPVITQNGNRWVGTGHNTVVTDFAGQDWTYYHAVDRNDPYYQGQVGYTKRPLLLDPLDWRSGWPVVRGDRGPSDQRVPGPVAQPGESATYRPHFAPTLTPGRLLPKLSDNFDGTALSSKWTWIRPPATAAPTVATGSLSWPTQQADLHPETPSTPLASVLAEPAPSGDYVVEAKVAVSVPAEGCCQNYVQGGILIYQNDGNYVKLASSSIFNTRQTEFGKEVTPVPAGYPHYGNGVVGPVGDYTYLRIVHRRVGTTDRYTSYSSLDGKRWDHGGTWTADLGSHPQIGLISMGGSGFTSTFDYVHVRTLDHACGHEAG